MVFRKAKYGFKLLPATLRGVKWNPVCWRVCWVDLNRQPRKRMEHTPAMAYPTSTDRIVFHILIFKMWKPRGRGGGGKAG